MLGNDLRSLLETAADPMRSLQLDQIECQRFPYCPSKQEVNSEIRRASKSRELASHAGPERSPSNRSKVVNRYSSGPENHVTTHQNEASSSSYRSAVCKTRS